MKDPVVCEVAEKYCKSKAQVLLKWAVQQNIGTIFKIHSLRLYDLCVEAVQYPGSV